MNRSYNLKKDKKALRVLAKKIKLVVFDFDGVFTDNRVLVFQDGTEAVFCNRGDGWGIGELKQARIKPVVISTEKNMVVTARCRKLKIDCIQNCSDKLKALKKEVNKFKLNLGQVAYLGNDVNDIECLKAVGLPACVINSHLKVFKLCKYITKNPGGFGAVREFCDFITGAKNE